MKMVLLTHVKGSITVTYIFTKMYFVPFHQKHALDIIYNFVFNINLKSLVKLSWITFFFKKKTKLDHHEML